MAVGAFALAALLHGLWQAGLQLPGALVAALALLSAAINLGIAPDVLPNSSWRVPQRWALAGPTGYSAIFGVLLGTGAVTARPSAGYPVLIAATLTLHSSLAALVLLGSFGLARGVVALPVSLSSQKFAALERLSHAIRRLRIGETALLIAVAISYLA
jgi:hypothetical protein